MISWHMIHFVIDDFLKKIAFNRTKVAIRESLCDNPIYSFTRYAINQCFYLMLDRIWLGISNLYAIKRYTSMRLRGMQLTNFVCTRLGKG